MRIVIVGAGVAGCVMARRLSLLDDVEVWAFDLNELHVAAINRDGLRLSGAGDVVGRPRATSDAAKLPPCDFGIVATKAMHTEPAIAATAHAFAEGCVATTRWRSNSPNGGRRSPRSCSRSVPCPGRYSASRWACSGRA